MTTLQKPKSKSILKRILHRTYKPVVEAWIDTERSFRYKQVHLKVFPGVFHPGLFYSTKLLLRYLEKFDLRDKTVLELGAGSGLLSIVAAGKKAKVTASDISQAALKNVALNSKMNHVEIELIGSDLFDRIPKQVFDFILIN
ncbi:MAG: methyltransferase, partial [Flavobacterium sp.]